MYLIPLLSDAQFETGQKVIGGNISFSTNSSNSTQVYDTRNYHSDGISAVINLSIAKFYSPVSLRGAGIFYMYNNSKSYSLEDSSNNRNGYKNLQHSIGINLFSQHFIPISTRLFFTIQTSITAMYGFGKQSDITNVSTVKNKGYGISAALAPGVSYKINKRFLFDAYLSNLLSAGYGHSTTTTVYPLAKETKTRSDNFNISTSLSNTNLGGIGFGFRWLLKR